MASQNPGPPPNIQNRASQDISTMLSEVPPVTVAPPGRDIAGYASWRDLGRRQPNGVYEESDMIWVEWVADDRSEAWRVSYLTTQDGEFVPPGRLRADLTWHSINPRFDIDP